VHLLLCGSEASSQHFTKITPVDAGMISWTPIDDVETSTQYEFHDCPLDYKTFIRYRLA